jgi:predicted RNA-binding Zn-ribbon protein involved in translation (DUF1610 family)
VAHTELTDEPCPECGASVDIRVCPPPVVSDDDGEDEKATVRLARVKVCPDCGWTMIL